MARYTQLIDANRSRFTSEFPAHYEANEGAVDGIQALADEFHARDPRPQRGSMRRILEHARHCTEYAEKPGSVGSPYIHEYRVNNSWQRDYAVLWTLRHPEARDWLRRRGMRDVEAAGVVG